MTIDFYDILGVDKIATEEEIKKAYRKLSKEFHPDKSGDREDFESISKAYETLSDPVKRSNYDLYGVDDKEYDRIVLSAIGLFKAAIEYDMADIIKSITVLHGKRDKGLSSEIKKIHKDIKNIYSMITRIKKSPKVNFISAVLTGEIKSLENQIITIEKNIEVNNKSFEMLIEYEFSVDEPRNNIYKSLADSLCGPSGFNT